jgi:hypothetical protein
MVLSDEERKVRRKISKEKPEVKAKRLKQTKEYNQRPEVKAMQKARRELPENKIKARKRVQEWHKKPENKAKIKAKNQSLENKEKQRNYYQTNVEKIKKQDKIYREKNRLKINNRAKSKYAENPEKYKKQSRLWRIKNPDKVKDIQKNFYHNNKEASKIKFQKWVKDNYERYQRQQKEYNKLHSKEKQKYHQDRRLLVLNHYSKVLSNSNKPICRFCGLVGIDFLHVDHIDGVTDEDKQRKIRASSKLIQYILDENFPKRFQILCGNCNWLKHFESKQKILSTKKTNVYRRKYLNGLKKEVLAHYSKEKISCSCCGFDNVVALTIDHIVGRKNTKHRPGLNGPKLYSWLKRNNYPKEFQVLCIMCNLAKHDKDFCPHQRKS